MRPDAAGPGQESVWDYPRPPTARAQPRAGRDRARRRASSRGPRRRTACSRPATRRPTTCRPVDFEADVLRAAAGSSFCEWKGTASYLDLVTPDRTATRAAWTYPEPSAELRADPRPRRRLPGTRGRVPGRRRGGAPAGRRLLRRLDHRPGRRAVQGRARHHRLVSYCDARSRVAQPISSMLTVSRSMLMLRSMVSSGEWYGGSSSAGDASPRQEKFADAMPTSWKDWWSLAPRSVTGEISGGVAEPLRGGRDGVGRRVALAGEGQQPVAGGRVPAGADHVVVERRRGSGRARAGRAGRRGSATRSGPAPPSPTARTAARRGACRAAEDPGQLERQRGARAVVVGARSADDRVVVGADVDQRRVGPRLPAARR